MSFSRWGDKQTVVHLFDGMHLSHARAWMSLKCIFLNERHQSEKAIHWMIPLIWHSGKGETTEAVRSVMARGVGDGRVRLSRWSPEDFFRIVEELYVTIWFWMILQQWKRNTDSVQTLRTWHRIPGWHAGGGKIIKLFYKRMKQPHRREWGRNWWPK